MRETIRESTRGSTDPKADSDDPYARFRQVLLRRDEMTPEGLDGFEHFLDRYVHSLLSRTGPLRWAQYRGFLSQWLRLGDPRASHVAADVKERAQRGGLRCPEAYLMAELQRCGRSKT